MRFKRVAVADKKRREPAWTWLYFMQNVDLISYNTSYIIAASRLVIAQSLLRLYGEGFLAALANTCPRVQRRGGWRVFGSKSSLSAHQDLHGPSTRLASTFYDKRQTHSASVAPEIGSLYRRDQQRPFLLC